MIISVVAAKIWYLKKCMVFIGPPCIIIKSEVAKGSQVNSHFHLNHVGQNGLSAASTLALLLCRSTVPF